MAMNHQEAMELERAIDRAQHEGITIMGRGTRKCDGARVFCVSSSRDPQRGYLVAVVGGRLQCECPSRKICKHRAVVHRELATEAQAATAARVAREADEAAARAASRQRETAILRQGRADNKPFSMWK